MDDNSFKTMKHNTTTGAFPDAANAGTETNTDQTMKPMAMHPTDTAGHGGGNNSDQTMKPMAMRSAAPKVGDKLVGGRYEILSELGRGGMGVVYRCFDSISGIEVALKALPPELSHNQEEMDEVRDNFQLVSKLVHQNIAVSKNLERDEATGDTYLVMECIVGENLRQWMRRVRKEKGGDIALDDVLPILRQVAEALDYAHSMKVMHRDIKPGNIMLTTDGKVKVMDFGLAAQIHSSLSHVSMAYHGTSGTQGYMAPEQWRGKAQGAAADQYALAVMAYEILSGHLPFDSPDTDVLKKAVLEETAEPIERVSAMVNQAIQRALSKDAATRFASCGEFMDAISGKRVHSSPSGKSYTRRITAGAVVIALLAGVFCYMKTQSSSLPVPPVDMAEMKEKVYNLHKQLNEDIQSIKNKNLDRGQTFGKHLDSLIDTYSSIEDFMKDNSPKNDKVFKEVYGWCEKAKEEVQWITQNEPLRDKTKNLFQQVNDIMKKAKEANGDKFAIFTSAEKSFSEAQKNYEQGNFQSALENFKKANDGFDKSYQDAIQELLDAGTKSLNAKQWRDALMNADKVLAMDADNDDARRLKSDAKNVEEEEQIDTAISAAKKASDTQDWEAVINHTEAILALVPRHEEAQKLKIDAHLACAKKAFDEHDWDAVEKETEAVYKLDPLNDKARKLKTDIEIDKKKENDALIQRINQERKQGFEYSEDGKKLLYAPKSITYYNIPEGVITIGKKAFQNCEYLKSINIPKSVVNVEEEAFYGCEKLSRAMFPGNLQKIENNAFSGCEAITELTIRGKSLEIKSFAFSDCKNLKSITFSGSINKIDHFLFNNCNTLEEIVFDGKIENIGSLALQEHLPIRKISISGNVGNILKGAFKFARDNNIQHTNKWNVFLSNGISHIEGDVFELSKMHLSFAEGSKYYQDEYGALMDRENHVFVQLPNDYSGEYIIPDGITEIGSDAFRSCEKLTKLIIPNSVKNIRAFLLDPSKVHLSFAEGSNFYQDKYGALIDKEKHVLIRFPKTYSGSYAIPDGIIEIGPYAFSGCSKLEEVIIPNTVIKIDNSAFSSCKKIKATIIIPESVIWIGDFAFSSCESINEMIVPNSVRYMGKGVFYFCKSLSKIMLPSTMKSTSECMFGYCESLQEITLPNDLTNIGAFTFDSCIKLESINIPNNTKIIGEKAFWNCSSLNNMVLPSALKNTSNGMFEGCESLQEIILPDGLEKIESRTFYGCVNLKHINIPYTVSYIGEQAFSNCNSLKNIELPRNINHIGHEAFFFCKNIETITLPKNLTIIYPGIFYGCEALKSISIPYGVVQIGYDAFHNCESLRSVKLPYSVILVSEDAFLGAGCSRQVEEDYPNLFRE